MKIDEKDFTIVSYETPKDLTYMKKFFENFEGFALEESVFDDEKNIYHKMIMDFQGEENRVDPCMTLIYADNYLVGVFTKKGFAVVSENVSEEDAEWYVSVKDALQNRCQEFINWLDENGKFAEEPSSIQ